MSTVTAGVRPGGTPGPTNRSARRPARLTAMSGVGLSQVAGGFIGGATGPYIVLLALNLDLRAESLGWIASAFGAGLLIVAAAGEWLLRLGPTRIMRAAAVLQIVACACFAFTPGLGLAAVAAGLSAIGGAAFVVAMATLLRGSTAHIALATGISSATGLVAPLAIGSLELVGIPGALAMLSPIPALLVIALVPVRQEPPVGVPVAADPDPVLPVRWSAVAVAWSAMVLAVAAEFCFFIWGVARLLDAGLSPGLAAILGVAFPLGMLIGRAVGARLRPVPTDLARQRVRWAAAITAAATVLVVVGSGPAWIAAGLFVAGLGLSMTYPLTLSLVIAVPGLLLRRSASIGASASGLAILLAPVALSALAGLVDLKWAFLLPLPLVALLAVSTVVLAKLSAAGAPVVAQPRVAAPVPAPRR